MNSKQLLQAIGGIEDRYILEADWENTKPGHTKKAVWVSISAAACLCLLAAGGVWWTQRDVPRWPIKELPAASVSSSAQELELAILRPWEELSVSEQYSSLSWNEADYSATSTKVESAELGDFLTAQTLTGVDPYTCEEHQTSGNIYNIEGISTACAVAVELEGDEAFYVYRNSDYRPGTLGQMMDDLSLDANLCIGSAWYLYQKQDGSLAMVEFVDLSRDTVFDMLLSDPSIQNVDHFDSMFFQDIMSVSISIPVLGYENISLSVTKEGYLTTNILDTGKAFYLGQDRVQAFVNAVLEHCQGYEIVQRVEEDSAAESGQTHGAGSAAEDIVVSQAVTKP